MDPGQVLADFPERGRPGHLDDLNHVGLILGLEVSRLARSNRDWHNLYELCAIFQTLLADQEGVGDGQNRRGRFHANGMKRLRSSK